MSSSRSIVSISDTGTAPVLKSGQIVRHPRFNLDAMREEYREMCSDMIARAYPAPSPNACAKAAAQATGIPRITFYRILRQETQAPDITAIIAALRMSRVSKDDGLRAYALLMKITAVQQ